VDLALYDCIGWWNSPEELAWQILLVNGVLSLGSSDSEVARFPLEVRKAMHIAKLVMKIRSAKMGTSAKRSSTFPWARGPNVDDLLSGTTEPEVN
jgi:hypothetical protein